MIPIAEIFGPTIQGEGPAIGSPSVFVRVGGCDYRCSWCDTLYAVDPQFKDDWTMLTATEVVGRVEGLTKSPVMVVLSGGNPALFDGLARAAMELQARGHQVAIETQGSIPKLWLGNLDLVVISPKPPSSGMPWSAGVQAKLEQTVACCLAGRATVVLKFVVDDETDYRFAKRVSGLFPERAVYLQPCDRPADAPEISSGLTMGPAPNVVRQQHAMAYGALVDLVLADRWTRPVVLPRGHVLAWGVERGR
jgi:7-carboxy-7-deazaguanine synthase